MGASLIKGWVSLKWEGGQGVNPFTNYALILHAFTVHQFNLNSFILFLSKSSSFAFYVPSLLECFGRNSSLLSSWPLEVLPILACGPVGLKSRPPQICYINVEFEGHRVPVIITLLKLICWFLQKYFIISKRHYQECILE